jgi:aminoglycoside 3-N-acetyltransferase
MIDRRRLKAELADSGLRPGMSVLVHCSMRRIGWVKGGATALREALLDVLGEDGTLIVPTQTPSMSDTSAGFQKAIAELDDEDRELHLKLLRGFDPLTTPSERMGALAESVRTHPRARRSAHPTTSFAALGRRAGVLCAAHPHECLLGADSPLGALRDTDGSVLLLGVGYDKCTAFHLGEDAAFHRERRYRCKVGDAWVNFKGFPHEDGDFTELGAQFEAALGARIRNGTVGGASTRLFPLALAADFASKRLPELRFAR